MDPARGADRPAASGVVMGRPCAQADAHVRSVSATTTPAIRRLIVVVPSWTEFELRPTVPREAQG